MSKIFISCLFAKTILTGFIFCFIARPVSAQSITNYTFAASSGTFTALSSPTNPALSAGTVDDGYFNAVPIGFDFWYMGTRYTTISASTNGWLTPGANITNATVGNVLATAGAPRPVIAPLWDDLDIQVATNVSYKLTGSAPNRVFTIQYLNAQWQYNATGNTISFQVLLHETTGKIEFIYRPETGALATPTASIGITATATGSGNYLSLNGAGTSPTVSSTSETTSINAKPASGQTYAFTPPVPTAPGSLTFSSVTTTSMTLNWTDLSSNERGFVIYNSTDGVNYSYVSQTAAGATSSAQSGLADGITYYWKVYAVSEGGLSTALSGSQATNVVVVTWYNSSWLYRKAITIDYTKVSAGSHTNFPVLINITDADLQTRAQADYDDILFTSSDGSTKLDHEVESYASGTGALVAWVEIPSLSSSANTVIYMYYGNASATAQQNITGTWNTNYKGVWHLNTVFTDATSNANNGTNTGTTAVTGKISGGRGFQKADPDYITISGKMGSPTSFTLSAWANLTTTDVNAADIISIADNSVLRYDVSNGKTNGVSYDGSSWNTTSSSTNYATGWHYVVYTFDDAGNVQQIYVDGQPDGAATAFTTSPNYTPGTNTFIGKHGNANTNMDFDGSIDEVRVSDASRSAGWVLTEYNNQNSPSTFYSVGGQTVTKTFTGTGNFSNAARWTGNTIPVEGDNLIIDGDCTVDNNGGTDNIAYGTLTIGTETGRTLNWASSGTNRLNVSNVSAGAGASTLDMTNGGTLIIRGTWTSTNLTFTSGTGKIEIQSTMTLPTAYATYYDLTVNGSGKTITAGVGTTINNNLTITVGTFTVDAFSLGVTGTASITGTMNITSATGAKSFGNLVINSGGTFTNTTANATVTIAGNLQNDGTFSQGTGSVTFTGAASNTISGAAATTAFGGGITVNKGTASTNVLDVQAVITMSSGGLILTNGTFKLSSNSTITAFTSATYSAPYNIPSTGGLWVNGGTVSTTTDLCFAGLVRVSAGILNIGDASDERLYLCPGSGTINIDGGTMNIAGRLSYTNATDVLSFTMSSGTLNAGTAGNSPAVAPFTIQAAASSFIMSGGTIVIVKSSGSNFGYYNAATTSTVTGGTLQIGNASTPASNTMDINSVPPIWNLTVNSTNSPIARLTEALVVYNDITISGGSINANNFNLTVGRNWSNNGSFTAGSATVTFNGTTVMSGTTTTNTFNDLTVAASSTLTSSTGITGLVVNGTLNTGASSTLDLGTTTLLSGTLSTISNSGIIKTSVLTSTSATSIPTGKNWGSTGTIEYAAASGAQTAVSGTYNNFKLSNTSGTNTAGGNITIGGILTFTAGTITTGSYTIYLNATGSVSRTSGHVIGNFQKYITTGATSKTFEIGDATNYTPAAIAFASVTTAGDLTVATTAGDHANTGTSTINPALTANRYWTLTNSGIVFTNYSATYTFVAGDLDAGADPTSFIVGQYSGGSWSYPAVGTTTATTTQGTGLTGFGDFQMGTILVKTWDGGAGTNNWGDAANWNTDGVPASTDDVDLTGANTININVAATAKNLLLNNAGLVLTINAGSSLAVSGSLTRTAGTFNASDGTIEMNGSSAQTIPAASFSGNAVKSLTINNNAGVTLGGALSLTDVLTVSNGSLAADGYLTLKSTATATARVAPITSVAATPISGNVIAERYVPGRRKYRLITSPVTTSTSSTLTAGQEALSIWGNWQNGGVNTTPNAGNHITGGSAADGFDTGTPNASLFTYDDVNSAYVGHTTANGKNTKYTPLKAGIAYLMFVYGDRRNSVFASNPNNTVLTTTGTLKTGDQTYNTSSSIPLSGVTGRYTLLGNPFASAINWATIPRTNVTDTYWGWDPNLSSSGGYVTVSAIGTVTLQAPYTGTTGLNQYIQSGQGFFVKTSGASPVITIREQDKVADFNSLAFRGQNDELPLLAINLQYTSGGSRFLADGVVTAFDDAFSNQVGVEDASKMENSAEGLAITNAGELLSIDARKMPVNNDTLFLSIARLTKPQYTLQIFAKEMGGNTVTPFLEDSYLNTTQSLSLSDTNQIVFNVDISVAASFAPNRFRIVFHSSVVLPVRFISVKATQKNEDILVKWDVAEEDGIREYRIERSIDGINFSKVGTVASTGNNTIENYEWLDVNPVSGNNYYRIRATETGGSYFLSKIVVVKGEANGPEIKVFPNPIQNRQINLYINAKEKGHYTVLLSDSRGQQIIKQIIDHPGGLLNKVISFNKILAGGVYHLQVINKNTRYHQAIMME